MKGCKIIGITLTFLLVLNVLGSGITAGGGNSVHESGGAILGQGLEIDLDVSQGDEAYSSVASPDFHLPTLRERAIEPHPAFYAPSTIPENTTINLDLFADATYTTNIHTKTEYINGITGIRGNIEGFELGFAVLSMGFERVYGTIEIPENFQRFIVQYDSYSDTHFVYEVDLLSLAEEPVAYAGPVVPDESVGTEFLTGENQPAFDPDPEEEVMVTVGVYYTPAARDEAGWEEGMAHKIANEIALTNEALQKSGTALELELAHSSEVSYAGSGNLRADLRRVTTSPDFTPWGSTWTDPDTGVTYGLLEYMDDVHEWRDQYSVDLVSLIVQPGAFAGNAWLLDQVNNGYGLPAWGFSVVLQQYLNHGLRVFAHEIGHNLGCHHHPNDDPPGPTEWHDWEDHFGEDNDWSAGHRWWVFLWGYNTIMSYSPLGYLTIPRFSNPDVTYELRSTGTETRNNARTIRTTKHIVASYRNTVKIEVQGGGTTDPEPGLHTGITRGNFSVTAIPSTGWWFSHWT